MAGDPADKDYMFENPYDVPDSGAEESKPPLESFIPGGYQQPQTQQQPPSQPPLPASQPQPQAQPPPRKSRSRMGGKLILLAVIIIVIIAAAIASLSLLHHTVSTTTSITTTVSPVKMTAIKSCGGINSSGTYYLTNNIKASIAKGACISVDSGNVTLIGNNNRLIGNGPYTGVPPFTYAIMVNNRTNVSIEGFAISNFSYGIYLQGVNGSKVLGNNLTAEVISGIFIGNSYSNEVYDNYVAHSVSKAGGIVVSGGSGNRFVNDTSANNAYYGFVVNSTGNTFKNDSITSNPVDIACNATSGLRNANHFSSKCSTNVGCSFAQCTVSNLPANLTSIELGTEIKSCGSISVQGRYYLNGSLNMLNYLNMSNPLSKNEACITINAPNVYLDCGGNSISNAGHAVSIEANYNDTVNGCKLYNDTYGIYLNDTQFPKVENITVQKGTYGIYVSSVDNGVIKNVTGTKNMYGIYMAGSVGTTINIYNLTNNTYGIYFASGSQNVFNNGKLVSNVQGDLYCTAGTYNSTTNLFQNSQCGVTDCNWGAICSQHSLPPISVYPVNNCTTISYPGSYALSSGIKASGSCFSIRTSNVSFSCGGKNILGTNSGTAFTVLGRDNVTISDCSINKFATGIMSSNTMYLNLQRNNMTNVANGIVVKNSSLAEISNNKVNGFGSGYAYEFLNVNNSIMTGNGASAAVNGSSSFLVANSVSNLLSFNTANASAKYGFVFDSSPNNQVFNNSAFGNSKADYSCSPDTSGLLAEQGGVNFGYTKSGCKWLVELNINNLQPACYAISSAAAINFTNDMLYPIGQTCFNVYNTPATTANDTIINCNFHTVIATKGGTFANIVNSSNVTIKNCYLKGFSKAITGSGGYMDVYNNTIFNSNVSILASNAKYPSIKENNIRNASYAIVLENSNYGSIFNNNITQARIALQLTGGISSNIRGNAATNGSIGMYMINSTGDFVQNNTFSDFARYGTDCIGASSNATASGNLDLGGNVCSSNSACYWMKSNSCLPG